MNDNKRMILNTGILYVKLILTTIIGLVSSRIILNALGVSDYGLYSVVGGIVTFLNVIGTTMVSVSYRYLAVELGKRGSKVMLIRCIIQYMRYIWLWLHA